MSEKKAKIKGPVVFFTAFKANAIDMLIILAISVTVLLLGDVLLRFLGYFVADMISMLLVLIIIVSVVYNTVMQCSAKSSTLGQRLAGIYLQNKQ